MDPITLGLVGAGVGLAKNKLIDAPRERRERELAAKTALYSPWTGMTPQLPQETDAMGTSLQGGLAGFQMGQGMQTQDMQNQYMQSMMPGQSIPMQPSAPMGGAPDTYESRGAIGGRRNASLPEQWGDIYRARA